MSVRRLTVVLIVAMMIFTSMAIISQVESTASSAPSANTAIASKPSNTSLFIVYLTGNPQVETELHTLLSRLGISGNVIGSLLSLNVPDSLVQSMKAGLSGIHGLYWTYNNNPIAIPMLYTPRNLNGSLSPVSFGPKTIASAYDFNWLYSHGINGKGITIGVIDAYGDPNIRYDVYAFDSVNHIQPINLTIDYANNQVPLVTNTSWALETATDVEWAHAMAPGANITLIVASNASALALQGAVSYAIDNRLANVISLSWGIAENLLGNQTVQMYSKIYKKASDENITILAASGDTGAYDGTSQLTVNFPASDPYVTGVGGTYLYIVNGVWKQSGWGGSNGGTNSFGSGGGYSQYFSNQSWEMAPGFSSNYRGVPDVSMIASTYSPVYIISQGLPRAIGGTSVATPIWAAVTALIKEKSGVNFGSENPLLYQISRTKYYNYSFTQILPPGNNGYYNVSPGWNPVTGLGTPIVSNLANITTDILRGYGTVVKMMGKSYNATGISATVKFNTRSYMSGNGTTVGFVGLYDNLTDYAIFGLAVSNNTQHLELMLHEGNMTYYHLYSEIGLSTSNKVSVALSLNYTRNGIVATYANQSIAISLPVFLSFSGNMNPAVGVWQQGGGTNITYISGVNFSEIDEYVNESTLSSSLREVIPFSYLNGYNSTIDLKNTSTSIDFYYGIPASATSSQPTKPTVNYTLRFSDPVGGEFSVDHYSADQLKWYVDGKPQNSGNITFPRAGYYNVSANLSGLNSRLLAYRTIYIPNITESSLNISTGLDYPFRFHSNVVLDYLNYISYRNTSGIPMLPGQNNIGISTHGFYSVSKNVTGKYVNITLIPMDVNVSLFVSQAASHVTFNGTSIKGHSGYYYALERPTNGFNITVGMGGFNTFYLNTTLFPGINVSKSVYLKPTNLSWVALHGIVTDTVFNFGIAGVNVSLNGTSSVYSNSTGYYILFHGTGQYNISAQQVMYLPFHKNINLSKSMEYNISLTPRNVSLVNVFKIRILSSIPFMFYFSYLSWTTYKGAGFEAYQIYIANNPSFTSGERIINFQSNTTGSTYLSGILPGHTYYAVVVLRLANGVFYESQMIEINYSNFLWLGITLLIYGAIIGYAAVAVYIFRRHKKKDEIQI